MTFHFCTPEQVHAKLKEEYTGAKGIKAATLSQWFNDNLTDAQKISLFALTDAKKLKDLKDKTKKSKDLLALLDLEGGL